MGEEKMQLIFTEQTSRVGFSSSGSLSLSLSPLHCVCLSRPSLSRWPVGAGQAAGEGGDRLTPGRPLRRTGLLSPALLFLSCSPQGWPYQR